MHTHALDSSIKLRGNNRVLKKRPPPISDEEQRLNRRQQCTLSQLQSEHYHLFLGFLVVQPIHRLCRDNFQENTIYIDILNRYDRVLEKKIRYQVSIHNMQFDFMPGKGTTDAIFILPQVQDKY